MSYPSQLLSGFAITVLVALCPAQTPDPANNPSSPPQLMLQAGGSLGVSRVMFGTKDLWIAVFDASDRIHIFDTATGRIARLITLGSGAAGQSAAFAIHPTKDVIASIGPDGALTAWDVQSGASLWRIDTGLNCSSVQYSPDGKTVFAACTEKVPVVDYRKLPPALLKGWDSDTGRQTTLVSVLEQVTSLQISTDSALCWGMRPNIPSAKSMMKALGRANSQPVITTVVLDCQSGRKLSEVPGMLTAVSGTQNRGIAVDYLSGNMFLQDFKTGARVALKFPQAPVAMLAGGAITHDGSRFITSTPDGLMTVDLASGAIQMRPAPDLPASYYGCAVSRDNEQFAVVQGDAAMLIHVSDPSNRRTLGSKTAAFVSASDVYEMSRTELRMNSSSIEQMARIQKSAKGKFGIGSVLGGGGGREMRDTIETQRKEAEQQEREREASRKKQEERGLAIMSKFGAISTIPAAASFLQQGRFLAVRSADAWWSVWDTATGNRLPLRTKPNAADLKLTPDSLMSRADLARLDAALSGRQPSVVTSLFASGSEVACQSEDGAYNVFLTRVAGKLQSLQLVSSRTGQVTDLLGTGLDFAALAYRPDSNVPYPPAPCSLSLDGSRMVVEIVSPGKQTTRKVPRFMKDSGAEMLRTAPTPEALAVYDLNARRELSRLESASRGVEFLPGQLQFSRNGERLFASTSFEGAVSVGTRVNDLRMWEVRTGKRLHGPTFVSESVLRVFPDELEFVTASSQPVATPIAAGIKTRNMAGKVVAEFPELLSASSFIQLNKNGDVIFGADRDNGLSFYNRKTGQLLGRLIAMQEGEWLVTTPSGYFDGSPRGWSRIAWKTSAGSLATSSGELFFNEFYRPGLLADLLDNQVPQAPRSISEVDRRQPVVRMTTNTQETPDRSAHIRVTVREAAADGSVSIGSGVRDIRLFRDGTLIKVWRGDIALNAGESTIEADVPLLSGENLISAYAFNRNNIRSEDATVLVRSTAEKRAGTLYLLSVGVNDYANREFNLRYAVPDAQRFSEVLANKQQDLGRYNKVITAGLFDKNATRANIELALSILGGRYSGALPAGSPGPLASLNPVQPEDAVIVFFAGHGTAIGDRYYLVPHDLGFTGPRHSLEKAISSNPSVTIYARRMESFWFPGRSFGARRRFSSYG